MTEINARNDETEAGGQHRAIPFHFHGQGGEYFRIWIVNILLTILTLGIYSPWAKVRNLRYFYGNTRIDGHGFDYLANPVAILKGRLAALVFLALYLLSEQFLPLLSILLSVAFILVLPWLICRAMAFRNHNTSYRNLRFGFDGRYGEACKIFILLPLAAVFTLGLLFPYVIYRQKKFLVANSRYGTRNITPNFTGRNFYALYLNISGFVLAAALLSFGLTTLELEKKTLLFIGLPLVPVVYFLAFAYISANTTNLIYNYSSLGSHGFTSNLHFFRLAWIYFTNALLVLLSLGLAIPWAKVRLARYRAQSLNLRAAGSLGNFIAAEDQRVGSFGEELGEALSMDIGP